MVVRGKIKNGKVVLDDPQALPDGAEVEVRPVKNAGKPDKAAKTTKKKARPRNLAERLAAVIGKAKNLPPDASANHDHYQYGVPKQR